MQLFKILAYLRKDQFYLLISEMVYLIQIFFQLAFNINWPLLFLTFSFPPLFSHTLFPFSCFLPAFSNSQALKALSFLDYFWTRFLIKHSSLPAPELFNLNGFIQIKIFLLIVRISILRYFH